MIIPDDFQLTQFDDFFPNATLLKSDMPNKIEKNTSCTNPSSSIDHEKNISSSSQSSNNCQTSSDSSNILDNENLSIQNNLSTKRKFFTKHEDHLLTIAAITHHNESWNNIAQCVPGRTPKQCRDRWVNYLQPTLKFDPWSENEDQILVSLVNMHGTHWTKMKNYFPNRSSNSLKNRWYWLIKNQVEVMPLEKSMNNPMNSSCSNQMPRNHNFNESHQNQFVNNVNINSNNYQFNTNDNINFNSAYHSNAQQQNDHQYYYLLKSNRKNNMLKLSSAYSNNKLEGQMKKRRKKIIKNNNNFPKNNDDELISILPEELNW